MSDILIADLTTGCIEIQTHCTRHYGRGLAVALLKAHTPTLCSRLSPENAFVIAPGLLTGAPVPCATRATVAARGDGDLAVCSITGDLPQKLASLDMAAIVLKGKCKEGNAVLFIDENGADVRSMPELQGLACGEIVQSIRSRFGMECAIIGCGPAADMTLPISGLFTTYPEGTPRFTCPRSSFGDVPGSKGLRAVVVKSLKVFDVPCADREGLLLAGKELAGFIINDPICGGALPGLGSITLLHLLKSRSSIPDLPKRASSHQPSTHGTCINRCCAPMCVIGCLNRHAGSGGRVFSAPEEAEVRAATGKCFGGAFPEDALDRIAGAFSKRGFELGMNATEFVNTAALYIELSGLSPNEGLLTVLMEEVARGTVSGRLLGGGTAALCRLFAENEAVQKRMTRPATRQENDFRLKLARICSDAEDANDLELLYRQIFVMENMGLCIFSSFALLNRKETLECIAKLYTYRTGETVSVKELLAYAQECLDYEKEICREGLVSGVHNTIPEFVKVLYRYFSE